MLYQLSYSSRLGCRRKNVVERVKGIEPSPPAWKAGALPLSYTRAIARGRRALVRIARAAGTLRFRALVGGAGFEPAKAEPPDLQSGPFGRFGIRPTLGTCDPYLGDP